MSDAAMTKDTRNASRSLQIHFDPEQLPQKNLLSLLAQLAEELKIQTGEILAFRACVNVHVVRDFRRKLARGLLLAV